MSYNAWSDHPAHPPWAARREACAQIFRETAADLAGGQEFTATMLDDLENLLPEYRWVGAGRDDGGRAGEFTPIFYRTNRVKLRESGTFWLAPDEKVPGLGWNARCRRTATWARVEMRETGQRFCFISTHFDHLGKEARIESARLLIRRTPELAGGLRVIVAGDLNCRPGSFPHDLMTREWKDARAASRQPPRGPENTWRGWSRLGLGRARIDYLFVPTGLPVHSYTTLDTPAARRASDHLPVVVRLGLFPGEARANGKIGRAIINIL